MPSKRRNNGRGKKNKGRSVIVNCINCGRMVGKDKAIKRFQMRKIVDESSKQDIQAASAYDKDNKAVMPKLYIKQQYCVSCAIHARVVRVRSQTRGDRDRRYTTKLRGTKNHQNMSDTARTGGFAVPAPSLVRSFQPRQGGDNN